MAKFDYPDLVISLFRFLGILVFEWDEGNSTKNEVKYGIKLEQIESCFFTKGLIPLGIQILPVSDEERYGILGMDKRGAILFICFTVRKRQVRVISARFANSDERKIYEEKKENC